MRYYILYSFLFVVNSLFAQQIIIIEYWINNDFVNRTTQFITTNVNNETDVNIPFPNNGTNEFYDTVHYRFKDTGGNWSPILSSNKDLMLNIGDKILSMEYWFDDGFANKQTTPIQTNETQDGILLLQQAEIGWQNNANFIHYRFLSKSGRWSPIVSSNVADLLLNGANGLPTLFLTETNVDITGQITLFGYNYTPNAQVNLSFYGAGGLYNVSITSNQDGFINYHYTPPANAQMGSAGVRSFDVVTSKNSPFKTFSIINTVNHHLQVTNPVANQSYNQGQSVLVSWRDKMVLAHGNTNYPVLPNASRREYHYIVEYQNSPTDSWSPINGNSVITGSARIDNTITFQTSALLNNLTANGKFRVRDFFNNSVVAESLPFEVLASQSLVSLEWDKSYTTNPVAPIGVVADGVSRLYIKVGTTSGTISHASISLNNGLDTSSNLLGKVMPANEINNFSNEANNATETTATNNQVVNNNVWFWYVSPDDFTGASPNDLNNNRRTLFANITIYKTNGATENVVLPIIVKRPQVLFAHGLMGDQHTFDDFKKDGVIPFENLPFESTKVRMMPGASFMNNAKALLGLVNGSSHTFQYLLGQDRLNGFASCQVDYVAHSMGGNIARMASTLPEFKNIRTNYNKGYIHKLITLGTPHKGSPIADVVKKGIDKFNEALESNENLSYVGAMGSLFDYGNLYLNDPNNKWFSIVRPRVTDNQNIATQTSFWLNVLGINAPLLNSYDFAPSQAISNLAISGGVQFPQTQIRSHLIVGDLFPGTQALPTLPSFSEAFFEQLPFLTEMVSKLGWVFDFIEASNIEVDLKDALNAIELQNSNPRIRGILKALKIIDYYNILATTFNASSFLLDSDGIVDIFSQTSGLPVVNDNNVSVFNYAAHTEAPNNLTANNQIVEKVIELLNSNQSSPNFSFIPSTISSTGGVAPTSTTNIFLDDLDFSKIEVEVDLEKMFIVTPSNQNFFVDAYEPIQVYINDAEYFSELELFVGKESYGTSTLNNGIVTFNVQIPNDVIGSLHIFARAKYQMPNDITKFLYSGLEVNVVSNNSEELLGLQPVRHVIEMWVGDKYRPTINGIYPSNMSIVDAIPSLNGNVLSYDESERELLAENIGETQVIYNFGGFSTIVYFTVRENYNINCPEVNIQISASNGSNLPCDITLSGFSGNISEIVWMKDGIVVHSNSNELDFTPTISGEYYAILTTEDGCTYTSNTIEIGTLGLNEIGNISSMKVYPNPTVNIINIENENDLITSIEIYNTLGQIVMFRKASNLLIELDISSLNAGIYILNVSTDKGKKDFKIIKK